jgi:hypothetical protein
MSLTASARREAPHLLGKHAYFTQCVYLIAPRICSLYKNTMNAILWALHYIWLLGVLLIVTSVGLCYSFRSELTRFTKHVNSVGLTRGFPGRPPSRPQGEKRHALIS